VLGDPDGCILPSPLRNRIAAALASLIELRETLWKPVHRESEMERLSEQIRRWAANICKQNDIIPKQNSSFSTLIAFKDAFSSVDDCRFPKFHATLHYPDVIRRFGSVQVCDAGAGERLHKVISKQRVAFSVGITSLIPFSFRTKSNLYFD
jgi:hypothetical protein